LKGTLMIVLIHKILPNETNDNPTVNLRLLVRGILIFRCCTSHSIGEEVNEITEEHCEIVSKRNQI
jgi:hypothetical protein